MFLMYCFLFPLYFNFFLLKLLRFVFVLFCFFFFIIIIVVFFFVMISWRIYKSFIGLYDISFGTSFLGFFFKYSRLKTILSTCGHNPCSPLSSHPSTPQQKLGWKRLAGSKPPVLSHQAGEAGGSEAPIDSGSPAVPSFKFQRKKKVSFPLQARNFYSHVMENKEVVKTLSLLSTCTLDIKPVNSVQSVSFVPYMY